MTPQVLVGVSSVLAVFLLPAAGYLFRRSKEGAARNNFGDGLPTAADDSSQEIEALRQQLRSSSELQLRLQNEVLQLKEGKGGSVKKNEGPSPGEIAEIKKQLSAAIADRDKAIELSKQFERRLQDGDNQVDEPTVVQNPDTTMEVLEKRLAAALEAQEKLGKEKHILEDKAKSLALELEKSKTASGQASAGTSASSAKELEAANAKLRDMQKRFEDAQTAIVTLKAHEMELSKQVAGGAEMAHKVEDQRARLAAAEAKISQIDSIEEERYKLKDQIKELNAEITRLKEFEGAADEKYDLAMKVQALTQKEQETDTLREQKAQLTQKLAQAETEVNHLADRLKELEAVEGERKDMAIKLEMVEKQIADVENLREENARIKASVEDIESMRALVKSLEDENKNLSSLATVSESAKPAVIAIDGEGLAGSLQKVLEKIGAGDSSRGAVVADEQGLVVAGIGDHAEALAAAAAVFEEVGRRVQAMLPLGVAQQISVVDVNKLTVCAQPFEVSSGKLTLATLSVGSAPERREIDELLRKAASDS